MGIKLKFLGLAGALSPLVWALQMAGCTSDNSTAGAAGSAGATTVTAGGNTGAGGSSSSSAGAVAIAGSSSSNGGATAVAGSSGSGAGAGTGGAATAAACAHPLAIAAAKPGIATFDTYTAGSDLAKWNFPLGGDTSTGALAGTFGFGDRATGSPETFEMSAGNASMYAMRIADTDLNRTPGATGLYGGGMGLWLSACLNATAFSGVSFWVRGSSPSPTATFTLSMGDTLSTTPSASGTFGTCPGTSTTCVNPTFAFPVTDTWTQIQAAWGGFKAGDAAGTPVTPDGRDITQFQWGVGLNFVPETDGGSVYVAVPGTYELVVDAVTFY